MRTKKLLFNVVGFAALTVLSVLYFAQNFESINRNNYPQEDEKPEKGIAGAIEHYNRLKADVVSGKIEIDKIISAKKALKNISSAKAGGLSWLEMGPNNVGGRVRALLIDNSDPNIMYAGGVNGGLWKSTTAGLSWSQIPLSGSIAVSSICQASNGDIYVGTGEGLASPAYTNKNSGAYGEGVYFKAANVNTFTHLSSATSSWQIVNRLAASNGHIYAATSIGLYSKTISGTSWNKVKPGNFVDVKAFPNKSIVVATVGRRIFVSKDDGSTWNNYTPYSAALRVEVAIAPSNNDVIYAVIAKNFNHNDPDKKHEGFAGIWRTTNGGTKWTQIAVGQTKSFGLLHGQGDYNNVVMVNKINQDVVYVGGLNLWIGKKVNAQGQFSWTEKTVWHASHIKPYYVHADQHVYVQHPTDANTFYQGTDGGVSKTTDGGKNFVTINTNFNVTQFYALAAHPNGGVMGGAQDNGTQFIDLQGNHPQQAREVGGGDGGNCAASMLNQEVLFTSVYHGEVFRSVDFGKTRQRPRDGKDADFFSSSMKVAGPFVTELALWETIDFPLSKCIDTVRYIADTNYAIGDVIDGRSKKNNFYPFKHTLQQSLSTGDTINILDPVQSRLYVGLADGIWMTREPIYFVNKTPVWYQITNKHTTGTTEIKVSRDGDVIFYSERDKLYRITNLLNAQTLPTACVDSVNTYVLHDTLIKNFSGYSFISSISIDPSDANRVVVTIAGTSSKQVYYSDNALSASPTFTRRNGNLPSDLPVYSSLILVNNSNKCIIGTEFGMYSTDNIMTSSPNWVAENSGMEAKVPVYMIIQQENSLAWRKTTRWDKGNQIVQIYPGVYNYGQIYAATHGRGIFTCKDFVSMEEKEDDISKNNLTGLTIFPNPVVNNATIKFDISKTTDVLVSIYNINGRMIREIDLGKQSGSQEVSVDVSDLANGMYIIRLNAGNDSSTAKFIKQ